MIWIITICLILIVLHLYKVSLNSLMEGILHLIVILVKFTFGAIIFLLPTILLPVLIYNLFFVNSLDSRTEYIVIICSAIFGMFLGVFILMAIKHKSIKKAWIIINYPDTCHDCKTIKEANELSKLILKKEKEQQNKKQKVN